MAAGFEMCQMLEGGHPMFIARSDNVHGSDLRTSRIQVNFKTQDLRHLERRRLDEAPRRTRHGTGRGGRGRKSSRKVTTNRPRRRKKNAEDATASYATTSLQASLAPVQPPKETTTAPTSTSATANGILPCAASTRSLIRTRLPQTRQGAIQKVGVQASKNLAVEMLRNYQCFLVNHVRCFQKPKDARKKHRDEKHVGHLEKFMETLEKQVYITKQEKGWRLRGRRSAHSAGTSRSQRTGCCEASHTETPIEEGDDGAESPAQDCRRQQSILRGQANTLLQTMVGKTGAVPPVEIALDDENDATWSLLQATTLLGNHLGPWFLAVKESVCGKAFHGPRVEDAEICGWGLYQLLGGAACRESGEPHLNHFYVTTYHNISLHTSRPSDVIHPVMALHQAYIMAAQCDHPPPGDPADFALWFSHTCFQVSFNLCFDLPDCIDIVYLSETRPTFVRQDGPPVRWIFASLKGDEIGTAVSFIMRERDLREWIDKPWALRAPQARQHRAEYHTTHQKHLPNHGIARQPPLTTHSGHWPVWWYTPRDTRANHGYLELVHPWTRSPRMSPTSFCAPGREFLGADRHHSECLAGRMSAITSSYQSHRFLSRNPSIMKELFYSLQCTTHL